MGLAGRKTKQRIAADPRNLTWSADSSKFGAKYLQSLGWTSGSGLGASGEGRTSNLKIHQKLDLMGIGANRASDDAGWKVGRQFEGLLARLNRAQNEGVSPDGDTEQERDNGNVEGVSRESKARGEDVGLETAADAKEAKKKKKEGAGEKRKRSVEKDEDDDKVSKRRKKELKKERKEKKKAEKEAKKSRSNSEVKERTAKDMDVEQPSASPATAQTVKVAPRYRAHRARHLASKRLAVASSTGMNEILGIASSGSEETRGPSSIPFPTLVTPSRGDRPNEDATEAALTHVKNHSELLPDGDHDGEAWEKGLLARSSIGGGLGFGASKAANDTKPSIVGGDDILRKSGKSVAEYFAEKLRMKAVAKDRIEPEATKREEPTSKERK